MKHTFLITVTLTATLGLTIGARPQTPASQAPAPQQPTDLSTTISGDPGAPPRFALPGFIALSADAETTAVAKTIADVTVSKIGCVKVPIAGVRAGPVTKRLSAGLERHIDAVPGVVAGTSNLGQIPARA